MESIDTVKIQSSWKSEKLHFRFSLLPSVSLYFLKSLQLPFSQQWEKMLLWGCYR